MSSDIWYREYLSVASQLDAMTDERDKLREKLRAYPDDPAAVMSRAFVDDLGAHFQKLEVELAVAKRRADNLSMDFDRDIKLYQAELAAEREARATVIKQRDIYQTALSNSVKERAKLREALEPFSEALYEDEGQSGEIWESVAAVAITYDDLRRARAALKETTDE